MVSCCPFLIYFDILVIFTYDKYYLTLLHHTTRCNIIYFVNESSFHTVTIENEYRGIYGYIANKKNKKNRIIISRDLYLIMIWYE